MKPQDGPLPELRKSSEIDEAVAHFHAWAEVIAGHPNDRVVRDSAGTVIALLRNLDIADRDDEVSEVAFRLREVAGVENIVVHRALYHVVIAETGRGDLAEAERVLQLMRAAEPGDQPSADAYNWAQNRFHTHLAANGLHYARGLTDLARDDWLGMKKEFALFEAAFLRDHKLIPKPRVQDGIKKAGSPESYLEAYGQRHRLLAKIDRVELDHYMATARFKQCRQRGEQMIEILSKLPNSVAPITPLRRRIINAIHWGAYEDAALVPEALSIHQERIADELRSDLGRFNAAVVVVELCLHTGRFDEAEAAMEHVKAFANGPAGKVKAATLEGRLQLDRGEPLGAGIDASWAEAYGDLLAQWERGRSTANGVSFMHYSSNRSMLDAGIRFAAHLDTGNGDSILDRYLAFERLGVLAERMRGRRGGSGLLPGAAMVREQLVAPGEVYLVPILSHFGSSMLLVTKDECRHFKVAPRWQISRAATDMQRLLGGGTIRSQSRTDRAAEIREAGRKIGEAFFPKPLLDAMAGAQLVTVVEGSFGSPIPLQLALVEDSAGELGLLGDQFSLSWVPSFEVDRAMGAPRVAQGLKELALVANVAVTGLSESGLTRPLDSVELDSATLRGIADPYGDRATVYEGAAGSEGRLNAGLLSGARLGIIIAHGWVDLSDTRPGTIVVGSGGGEGDAADGLWRCSELELASLPDVMVLATCRAGAGPIRMGDAHSDDLGGACLLAGVQAVLFAQGDLPLASTVVFVRAFSQALSDGETVAAAAQHARRAVRRDERFDDPYHFAQLQVLGRGDFRPFPGGSSGTRSLGRRALPIALGALLAVLAGWWLWRRRSAAAA